MKSSSEFQDGVMAGYMEYLEEIKNVYRILFGKPDEINFREHGHKWDSNVKVDFKENVGCIL